MTDLPEEIINVVALSGGKDSTALALQLAEVESDRPVVYMTTPTGDELPEMVAHMDRLRAKLGKPIEVVTGQTLRSLIEGYGALPNFRQRWCTRQLKVQPCIAWMVKLQLSLKPRQRIVLCVGLRADEPERLGLYSDRFETRFPMREWGWGLKEVWACLNKHDMQVPKRTDCARCYGQRLGEWWSLWKHHPAIYADAEAQEDRYGHTLRSPQRDTWPAALKGLRARFEAGDVPKGADDDPYLDEEDGDAGACRLCRL